MSVRFTQVLTPENIYQGGKRPSASVLRSKIPIHQLALSETQRSELDILFRSDPSKFVDILFEDSNQAEVQTFLEAHKLDPLWLDTPTTKWCTKWSNSSKESFKHVLLQCRCGYSRVRRSTTRGVTYDYTGCLAHVEITTERETGHVRRIQGMLEHNPECQASDRGVAGVEDVTTTMEDSTPLSLGYHTDESTRSADQLIARTMKKHIKWMREINAALDHVRPEDLENPVYREELEKLANEFELIAAKMRHLLRRTEPLELRSQVA